MGKEGETKKKGKSGIRKTKEWDKRNGKECGKGDEREGEKEWLKDETPAMMLS